MYGNLVRSDTVFACPHGGRGVAATPPAGARDPAVRLDGAPLATAAGNVTIDGCPRTPPCTTIRWTPDGDAARVDGAPVLLDTTRGLCFDALSVPQGPPQTSRAAGWAVRCR